MPALQIILQRNSSTEQVFELIHSEPDFWDWRGMTNMGVAGLVFITFCGVCITVVYTFIKLCTLLWHQIERYKMITSDDILFAHSDRSPSNNQALSELGTVSNESVRHTLPIPPTNTPMILSENTGYDIPRSSLLHANSLIPPGHTPPLMSDIPQYNPLLLTSPERTLWGQMSPIIRPNVRTARVFPIP